MDCWVEALASQVLKLVTDHLRSSDEHISELFTTEENNLSPVKKNLFDYVERVCNNNDVLLHEKIASSFYDRYKNEVGDEQMWKKMCRKIHDAEMKGYDSLRNNCQTVVNDIIKGFCEKFRGGIQQVMEKSLKLPKEEQDEIRKQFLVFPSKFNIYNTDIGPFGMRDKVPYFETFGDIDTCRLFMPKNFNNIH